jgi:antitoxin Phd
MSKTRWSLSEAKDHFSELVDAAREGTPQTVTRHGRAAVVVLKAEDYERIQAEIKPAKTFVEYLLAAPKGDSDLEVERLPARPRDVVF